MESTKAKSAAQAGEATAAPTGEFPQAPLHALAQDVTAMGSQLGEYLSQERGRAQAGMIKILLIVGAIPLTLLLLAAVLLLAWVWVFYGTTAVLAQALDGKTWLAALIVGGSVLVLTTLVAAGLWFWTSHRVKRAKRRAKRAKVALRRSWEQTQASAKQLASPIEWTERYPLPVTGVAFLAGFTLSGPLTARSAPAAAGEARGPAPSPVFDRMQLWATLINTGAEIFKNVVTPLLQDMVQPKEK